jgi:putative tryptophan/tyrosine transport system substrate-binding protein
MMKPKVLALLASVVIGGFVCAAAAQTTKSPPRIGFISSTGASGSHSPLFNAFQMGLRDLGYIDGKNIVIVHRYAEGRLDRMPVFVYEFVQQEVDVIVAVNNVAIRAAREATKTIPIVMVSSIDPVAAGYVESFVRPGGNITGLAWLNRDISAKRVELLREMIPRVSRVGILWDADGPGPAVAVREYETAAQAFKMDLRSLAIRGPGPDLTEAFQASKAARVEALIVVGNALASKHAPQIFELATRNRLPSMTEARHYVEPGGLISYGANLANLYQRAAGYVIDAELVKKCPLPISYFDS